MKIYNGAAPIIFFFIFFLHLKYKNTKIFQTFIFQGHPVPMHFRHLQSPSKQLWKSVDKKFQVLNYCVINKQLHIRLQWNKYLIT